MFNMYISVIDRKGCGRWYEAYLNFIKKTSIIQSGLQSIQ